MGLRRVSDANEINTKNMKCTCPTQRPNARDPTQPIFHWLALGFCVGRDIIFIFCVFSDTNILSLYSTRTQNTCRRGLALGNAPNARFLRYPTQNIPTCWYILALPPTPIPDANPKICVTPDANPRRQSVEYSWRWVPTQNAGVDHVYFFFFV